MNKFKSMLAGKERLIFTFWIWGVVASLVFLFLIGIVNKLLGYRIGLPMVILSFAMLGYWVVVAIGIWRSASAYKGNNIWGILAKLAVVLAALGFGLMVIGQS